MKTECGIFACIITSNLDKQKIYNAMSNIQHRGQDSYGYITITPNPNSKCRTGANINIIKEFGLLCGNQDFIYDDFIYEDNDKCLGKIFLGHMRYSTNTQLENSLNINNIQPIEIRPYNHMYIAHNGNLPNLKDNMDKLGLELKYEDGMNDTHFFNILWHKLRSKIYGFSIDFFDVQEYIQYIINNIPGAYACVLSYYSREDGLCLFGFRDKLGYKPLSICEIDGNYCFVSETVQVLDNSNSGTGGKFITDVNPGEIWVIKQNGIEHINKTDKVESDNRNIFFCALEPIYFMKKDSLIFNGVISVSEFRELIGIELAKQDLEMQINICMDGNILYIPESSYSIACGYYSVLGNSSSGNNGGGSNGVRKDLILKIENIRSFIESTHDARIGKLKRKFAFNIEDIKKLREIILIDDSIVRGNSMKFIVDTLYSINPKLIIHIRVGCPKLVKGCNFGIDLYDDELIALQMDNLAEYFKVASIRFLELDRLQNIFAKFGINNCGMCFGNISNNNIKTLEW